MTRIDRLAENQLEASVAGIEQQLDELRAGAPQFIGGASILFYQQPSGSTWDWTGTLYDPSSSGNGSKLFLITATATTMPNYWGYVLHDMYVDTAANRYDLLQYFTDYKNSNFPIGILYTDAPSNPATPNVKSWFASVTGNSTRNIWLRFRSVALDTASITVTVLL